MTSKGLIVVEQEEVVGPSSSTPDVRDVRSPSRVSTNTSSSAERAESRAEREAREAKRSPIGELLYMRWLEGLRLKWPSIL